MRASSAANGCAAEGKAATNAQDAHADNASSFAFAGCASCGEKRKDSAEIGANLWALTMFTWVTKMFKVSQEKWKRDKAELEDEDLWDVTKWDDTIEISSVFEKYMDEKMHGSEGGIGFGRGDREMNSAVNEAVWNVIRKRMVEAGWLKVVNTVVQFCFPFLLNKVLQSIQKLSSKETGEEEWRAYLWVAGFGLSLILKTLTMQAYQFRVLRSGWQARSAITTAVYRKTLLMSASARQSMTTGEVVNLMQLDATKIERFIVSMHNLWDGLLQIVGFLAILIFYIGWPSLLSFAVILVSIPFVLLVFLRIVTEHKSLVKSTDARVKLTNEVLQNMSAIKMSAWEGKYTEGIDAFRATELSRAKRLVYILSSGFAFMLSLPNFIAVVVLAVFALVQTKNGESVDAPTLFTALSTFTLLQAPLLLYPGSLSSLSVAIVSRNRLGRFFGLPNVNPFAPRTDNPCNERDLAIQIVNGRFCWEKARGLGDEKSESLEGEDKVDVEITVDNATLPRPRSILENVNLDVKKGSLTAIVGPVGCGKTSLINAILNEMHCAEGSITRDGTVAFASQSAWIFNDTIRANILFGEALDEDRYLKVIQACQLAHDFEILQDGDMTVIGERGINLSGGQKQRISVARAAYSQKDIVILDDPLSALDPEVARAVFTQCIATLLNRRTRVLVTNQLYFLPECDQIVVLEGPQGEMPGRIVERGSYTDLLQSGLDFSILMKRYHQHQNESGTSNDESMSSEGVSMNTHQEKLREEIGGDLIQVEERVTGAVQLRVYKSYIQAGTIGLFLLTVCLFVVNEFALVFNRAWVTLWTDDASYQEHSLRYYLVGYFLTATIFAFTLFFAFLNALSFGLVASFRLHADMLKRVLRAPMSFYDTTPIGRIVSRFSKDIHQVDYEIPQVVMNFIFLMLMVIFSVVTVGFITPWFLAALPVLVIVYVRILNFYRPLLRATKRLESISRSPVYSHFSETLSGLSTIRAYEMTASFKEENASKVNCNIKSWYLLKGMECWLGVRLGILGSFLSIFAALLALVAARAGSLSAGLAGLSLNFAVSLTTFLEGTVVAFATLEAGANAVERILHYSKNLDQEAPFESPNPPPPSWPSTGEIQITDLQMRYRENTPLVLKGVSLTIQGGHHVGICGRTGSGKSSMLVALLRLVEPLRRENGNGSVFIDGIDFSKIGLHELRSKVSIVPQNPVMFSGTVRSNLDPFKRFSEDNIWQALERCKVRGVVEECGGLDGEVSEYGENFSQGQRQLLCFARSILVQNRILLLDEATSSVDYETDAVIQETIRSSFSGCTILTIAHRLNTVIDSDKILVLDAGKVAEYDSPHALLSDSGSVFSGMVNELGAHMAETLKNQAKEKSFKPANL